MRVGWAAMLLTDHMIYLAAEERVLVVDEAVFAEMVGAYNDLSSEAGTDVRGTHVLFQRQTLPGTGFGETHDVFELHVMLQL